MTRGDDPRISLLRTWSKAHHSDFCVFQCALDQTFSIFHVAEFPFRVCGSRQWDVEDCRGNKNRHLSLSELRTQNWHLFWWQSHLLYILPKSCWPSIQIPKYGFRCFLSVLGLETLTYATSHGRGCRLCLELFRCRWIYLSLCTFMSRQMQNTWLVVLF